MTRRSYPTQAWYVVATSDEVTGQPLGRRALDTAVCLFRTSAGEVAALEDRDAHAPYPLSLGHVHDDELVSAYSGFAYAADGRCVRVPTQAEVPYGARVRCFPVREQDGFVWLWFGDLGRDRLRPPPHAPWLQDAGWATLGEEWTTSAHVLLLHENFADITHVAVVDPLIAPPVLSAGPVPELEVEVTETTVAFQRQYPDGPVADWLAPLLDLAPDATVDQREEGRFVAPGLWVDSWDYEVEVEKPATFRFTHAVTPVDDSHTQHVWRVSRNFAPGDDVSENLRPLFVHYYSAVRDILETMQRVLSADGPRHDVRVAADAAAVHVRRIVQRMGEQES